MIPVKQLNSKQKKAMKSHWYCRNCNEKNQEKYSFCVKCGVFAREPRMRKPMK